MRCISLLLILALLLSFVGCAGGDGEGTTTVGTTGSSVGTTTEANSELPPPEDLLVLAEDGKSDFSLVYGSQSTTGALQDACEDLAALIFETTGATLPVHDDLKSGACEILIGDLLRTESRDALEDEKLGASDFLIRTVRDGEICRVVILGGSDAATLSAVQYFLQKVAYRSDSERVFGLSEGVSYLERAAASGAVRIDAAEETALRFTLYPEGAETRVRLTFAGEHAWRLQTAVDGEFSSVGASQLLALSVGETPVDVAEPFETETASDRVILTAADGSRAVLFTEAFRLEIYSASGKLAATVNTLTGNSGGSSISGELLPDEAIFGTGERFDTANQRGNRIDLYTKDAWDRRDANYMAIPLLLSSRGSGIFVNRYEFMTLDLGKTEADTWSATVTDAPMDCYLYATDALGEVLYGYSTVSGFAEMPEEWTYGMLVCSGGGEFSTMAGVNARIDMMEKYDLPWTGIILEGWGAYYESGWRELTELCDRLHALGKKVLVYIRVGEPPRNYSGTEYLMTMTDGQGNIIAELPDTDGGSINPDVGENQLFHKYVDITNPDAMEWFFEEFWYKLSREVGVDGAKIDFCETIPEYNQLNFYDEDQRTAGTHHWYPTAFCNLFWKMISSKPDSGMCFSRGGGIGSQRSPFMWAGDQTRQFDRLQWQLTGVLSSGLSGVPFMSYDMSGYQAKGHVTIDIKTESKVFLRGTQFTAFTANMQTHGRVIRRPYDFAEEGDVFTTDVYRAYCKLHELLTPYITEYSAIASQTGMPLVRHLVLGWQADEKVYDIIDEYMFGDAFLVAPELNGSITREVYLPEGRWQDLWTGETYTVGKDGRTLSGVSVAMTQIPVFLNLDHSSETVGDLLPGIEEIFSTLREMKP